MSRVTVPEKLPRERVQEHLPVGAAQAAVRDRALRVFYRMKRKRAPKSHWQIGSYGGVCLKMLLLAKYVIVTS